MPVAWIKARWVPVLTKNNTALEGAVAAMAIQVFDLVSAAEAAAARAEYWRPPPAVEARRTVSANGLRNLRVGQRTRAARH